MRANAATQHPVALLNGPLLRLPDAATLRQVFHLKYGTETQLGWGPKLRRDHGYSTPDDVYEALLASLCVKGLRWLDIGCGRELCPSNPSLAKLLAQRVGRLVGLDPDPTLDENPYVHEKIKAPIDGYESEERFDLAALRMVAEHIDDPEACVRGMVKALAPGGLAIVYTVFAASPMPLLTRLAPMGLRHTVKRFLWRTDQKDTFPTRFRMNTRGRLQRLFGAHGLREEAFLRLDDCRTFSRFRWLLLCELRVRTFFRALGMPYPEHCILGAYRKP